MANIEMFDGVLMNIVQKAEGIEGFYESIFSFMRRKTDFYCSPDKGKEIVMGMFNRNLQLFQEDKFRQEQIKKKHEENKKKQDEEAKAKQAVTETENKVEEITDEEAEQHMNKDSKVEDTLTAEMEKAEGEGSDDDGSLPPLPGNGLKTDRYMFTQSLQDISLSVFIPEGTKAKDLIVEYGSKKLKVQVKGQDPIINGELPEKILTEETLWTIETVDGARVCSITLDKSDKMKWWDCIVIGEPKLNTKKIEPENSKLSDLDGDTRQTVEKMMFDQQQKQKGLPSSDEMEKQNKMKAFMDAHPEMDFSKAKFS